MFLGILKRVELIAICDRVHKNSGYHMGGQTELSGNQFKFVCLPRFKIGFQKAELCQQ